MNSTEMLVKFLSDLGARRRRYGHNEKFVLDDWCSDFYLIFDVSTGEPEQHGTADILAAHCGVDPRDVDKQIVLRTNSNIHDIWVLMCSLGIDRFKSQTRSVLNSFAINEQTCVRIHDTEGVQSDV